ncbi:MAG: class I SAM-dependent methyltransferase [Clostridiales bacterium]|nr:class I SAM-dependent methyltransferase [Clostridiales bacterium]
MGLYRKFVNQTRKPEGVLGKVMVNGMNGGHAKLADWGMSYLPDLSPDKIAELGCGGGRNAGELALKYPRSQVFAIDYSEVSVAKAKEYNSKMIEAGRVSVQQGDVSNLKLSSETYDLATAFETIYFWPGLDKCFGEVARILRPGGTFMIVNESDGKDEASLKYEKIIDGMKCYKSEDIKSALITAGFTELIDMCCDYLLCIENGKLGYMKRL